MVGYFSWSVTLSLLYVSLAVCLQDDHLHHEFGHDQRREEREHFRAAERSQTSGNTNEVSTEHMQRYWGHAGLSFTPLTPHHQMHETVRDVSRAQYVQEHQQHTQHQQQPIQPIQQQYQQQQQQHHQPLQQQPEKQRMMDNSKLHQDLPQTMNVPQSFSEVSVGGLDAFSMSPVEQQIVGQLKGYIAASGSYSTWLHSATNAEIVRFLRARKCDIDAAWQMLWEHSLWRLSPLGPDTFTADDDHMFEECSLNEELYWAGHADDGSPVLFFRTGLHQTGAVDSMFYTRFVVWQLERAKRKYGVGTTRQLYIIVDRTPSAQQKDFSFGSPSASQNLPIMKAIFTTVQDNYPEILKNAFIVPANTVTRMLFMAASAVMDENSRGKFKLIKSDDYAWWSDLFQGGSITQSLGGFSGGFVSERKNRNIHGNR